MTHLVILERKTVHRYENCAFFISDLRSEELRENMLGEVWNQVTSNRISATPPPNLEMMRGRGSRTQIGLKRRSLCLTPKLEPLERKKRRKTLIQLPIRENFSKTENASCVSLRQISTAIMAPPRREKSDEEDEFKDDSSFTSENESKENIPNIPTPRKRGKSLGLTPQNTPIRSPNVRTDSIIRRSVYFTCKICINQFSKLKLIEISVLQRLLLNVAGA